MKREIIQSLLLTISCILLFSIMYPAIVSGIACLLPNKGDGQLIEDATGKKYYRNIGQRFTEDAYFWSRPSAVGYNAAGSGGSNKGPANPEYLQEVQQRIDTFLAHNPGINKTGIPSELVTASGSGLDPDISIAGAEIQITRIARARKVNQQNILQLVRHNTQKPLFHLFGPSKINVLQLNIDLDHYFPKH